MPTVASSGPAPDPAAPRAATVVVIHATARLGGGTLVYLRTLTAELDALETPQLLVHARAALSEERLQTMFAARIPRVVLPPARLRPSFMWAFGRALRAAVEGVAAAPLPPRRIVVHLHGLTAGVVGRLALLPSLPPGVTLFYSAHGPAWLDRRRRLRNALLHGVERLASLLPAQPVGCGRSEARRLQQITGRAAAVLEPPVAGCFLALRRRPSYPPLVVAVGRLCEQKGPERFAALAMRFQILESPVRFVWIGAGDDERAAQLAGAGVTVTGWLEHDQVADWLAQATVFVQTSHWEALPMALLEAMAAGVPCVATDAAAHRDVIEHGVTGLVATDVDQLARHVHALLADEPLARRLAEAARRAAAARCSGDVFRERLARLYGLPGALPAPRPTAHDGRPPAGRGRVPTLSG